MDFQRYVFSEPYFGWLCRGILFTLIITILTTVLSILLGSFIASCRLKNRRWLRGFGIVYINTFRNIPPVPLLLFLVFGLPSVFAALVHLTLAVALSFFLNRAAQNAQIKVEIGL